MNMPAIATNHASACAASTHHSQVRYELGMVANGREPRAHRALLLRAIAAEAMQLARSLESLDADPSIRARRDEDLIRVELPGQSPRLMCDADAAALRDQLEVALHVPPTDEANRPSRL